MISFELEMREFVCTPSLAGKLLFLLVLVNCCVCYICVFVYLCICVFVYLCICCSERRRGRIFFSPSAKVVAGDNDSGEIQNKSKRNPKYFGKKSKKFDAVIGGAEGKCFSPSAKVAADDDPALLCQHSSVVNVVTVFQI